MTMGQTCTHCLSSTSVAHDDSMAPKMPAFQVMTILLCVTALSVFLTETDPRRFSSHLYQAANRHLCTCGKCLSENDTWFMSRFVQAPDPYLSAHSNLSEEAFDWWKRLQTDQHNFSIYQETVNSLFEIFPPNPDLLEPRPEKCRTCAVVGNSVNLKGSGYGPLIDLHDVIIRINFGHTKGYEADVGNRTTHRIMYPESSTDLDDTTHLVLFPFKIRDLEWLVRAFTSTYAGTEYGSSKSVIKANRDLVTVLNPAFMKYVHEVWLDKKGRYSSTGFMAVILALHVCGEVDVFGFGADKDGNWNHYWEKLKIKDFKTGIHPGTHEYEMIQELANNGKISFYPGR